MVDILFLNGPAAASAHLTKRLELCFRILPLKVVIRFGVIIENMAAFAALFLGNSGVECNIQSKKFWVYTPRALETEFSTLECRSRAVRWSDLRANACNPTRTESCRPSRRSDKLQPSGWP